MRPAASSVLAAALALSGALAVGAVWPACASTPTVNDMSVVAPGCRAPSACWDTACACARGGLAGCKPCDPANPADPAYATGSCDCAAFAGTTCQSETQVCVGRGPACPGEGARCLAAGGSCEVPGGAPPQLVGGDAGLEARCPFTDDVCCPAAQPDAGSSD